MQPSAIENIHSITHIGISPSSPISQNVLVMTPLEHPIFFLIFVFQSLQNCRVSKRFFAQFSYPAKHLIMMIIHFMNWLTLRGDPNQNLKCLLAITLKLNISDPMLVKPKCVSEVAVFWKIANKQLKKCKQISEDWKKNLQPLKYILALPTWGQIQKCLFS